MAQAFGWPFLIARGYREGFRVIVAPDFLVAGDDYRILADSVRSTRRGDPPETMAVTLSNGRCLGIAHTTRHATATDTGPGREPHDLHGRALPLLYGFVCPDATVTNIDADDLLRCAQLTAPALRRFLAGERGHTVESSKAIALRSRLQAASGRPKKLTPEPVSKPTPKPGWPRQHRLNLILFIGLVLLAVGIVGLIFRR